MARKPHVPPDRSGTFAADQDGMSHLAFVAPPFLGHLHPMLALADELAGRGHAVSFLGIGDVVPTIAPQGHTCVTLGRATHPAASLERMAARIAAPHGLGFFRILRDMMGMTRMLCREMPAACRDLGVDGLVVDQLEPAGGIVARALGLPFMSVANALPINREPAVPPPFTDWDYDPSARGLARNRAGYGISDLLMQPLGMTIASESARLQAGAARSLEDCLSPAAEITQLVPELDFPRARRSSRTHACGPLRSPSVPEFDTGLLGPGRPIVFASLGSLQGGRADLFRTIAAACLDLDLHLVIAHGGRLAPAEVAALPGAPTARDFVPQRALLRHAALAITNGGLNTVLDAAAAGVPMLVIPIAFEQGATAARVMHAGIGASVGRRRVSRTHLRDRIAGLLDDGAMRARARALATAMAAYGGAAAAADVVEAVMGTGMRRPASPAAALAVPA